MLSFAKYQELHVFIAMMFLNSLKLNLNQFFGVVENIGIYRIEDKLPEYL